MAKRRTLSKEEKNRRKRERDRLLRAQKREQKKRRSEAAKKGWETRRRKKGEASVEDLQKEIARLQAEIAQKNRIIERQPELFEAIKQTFAGTKEKAKEAIDAYFAKQSPEEIAELKEAIRETFLREETTEEKHERMVRTWREISTIVPGKFGLRWDFLLWIQRNNFDEKDFWAEYRRRKG